MKEIIKEIARIDKELEKRDKSALSRYNKGEKVHLKQLAFHRCQKRNKWVFGGNRSGKTECGAVEAVWLARGIHPYLKNKDDVCGWVVSLSAQVQRDVAQQKILKYLDKSWIKEVVMSSGRRSDAEYGVIDYIVVKNVFGGLSRIGFRNCEAGRDKFQGTSLDFVWFDEEPPYEIYRECRMRVMDRKGRIFIGEPSVVAVDVKSRRVLATGNEAKAMIGRTPGSIIAIKPLQDGVIADFDMTADMLHNFIYRSSKTSMFTKTRVVITVPSGVTEVERRAVEDAARAAGAQEVELIEEPMAAALGAGLPVFEASGSMVVDIGGGTCDIAVMSLGGIAARKSVKIAGNALKEAIIGHMKKEHNLLIGDVTAEDIKIKIGSVSEYDGEGAMEVRGRNLADGLPNSIEVTSEEIRNVLTEPVGEIVEAIRETLEVTLPELAADIIDRGIYITGGTALLRGLPELISKETKITVHIPENPMDVVAIGTSVKLRRAR